MKVVRQCSKASMILYFNLILWEKIFMMVLRSYLIFVMISVFTAGTAQALTEASFDVKNPKNQEMNKKCITCHLKENKSLVLQWENSAHAAAKEGQVGCFTCHAADKGYELGYEHEGAFIKAVLSPRDCAKCHEPEAREMAQSHHATAGEIMASLDNMLAEVVGGMPSNKGNMASGCWQCHGSVVSLKRDKDGKPMRSKTDAPQMDYNTWPNSGIGRINPDGTKGACNACHSKHSFSASRARQPENCGKCHLGPDHPQKEIYEESKHGIAYFTAEKTNSPDGMNIMKDGSWVLGDDYHTAPTCSTCHMGSFIKLNGAVAKNSHNVGDRISWNLRAVVSSKLNRVTFTDKTVTDITGDLPPRAGQTATSKSYVREGDKLKKIISEKTIQSVVSWKQRRTNMQEVCKSCHGVNQAQNFYRQLDDVVMLYNEKFAKPGVELVNMLKKDEIWKNTGFQNKLGFTWFEIWHHEGRRARMAAAMFAPDYTHWHGMYEIARNFYHDFLPEVQEMADHAGKGETYRTHIKELLAKPEHLWIKTGGSAETMKLIEEENKLRYNQ
ncbi:Seven times multi-haem cytochrome CxxCH [Desulfobacula phenolica]|uniref:Seven times multi-haem cytochrome CxxCH n=2 Tax=Desulfobacula phenolica TaxID=90732 RepID=A0A1H2JB49_9BACT|nr:Seven times multi-haem cytochrome CxxCH [Desulfobacula phenolica]